MEIIKLRIYITATHQNIARIKEVVVWPSNAGALQPIPAAHAQPTTSSSKQGDIPQIYLNQSGFNLGKPKRFTAPTLPDGTHFLLRDAKDKKPLYQGTIRNHIGDFSPFNPEGESEYVVEAGSLTSVPFRIGLHWLERVTYQNAVDFMIDSRHYVGNYREPCRGSFGWRDDHHCAWELHSLVPQYLSNPSAYERMPRQVTYEKPNNEKSWGALDPYKETAPDIVKLIHWGADIIVTQKLSHELLKTQLAYFLYAWPALEPHLPAQNYQAVLEYAFRVWNTPQADQQYPYDESKEHDLLALKTTIGTTKGSLPSGFSIEPNLLLYEVAKREKRADANLYFDAAQRQTKWLIQHLDWEAPLTTKGQRVSEWITVTEDSPNASTFTGRIKIKSDQPLATHDQSLQVKAGTSLKASHG